MKTNSLDRVGAAGSPGQAYPAGVHCPVAGDGSCLPVTAARYGVIPVGPLGTMGVWAGRPFGGRAWPPPFYLGRILPRGVSRLSGVPPSGSPPD